MIRAFLAGCFAATAICMANVAVAQPHEAECPDGVSEDGAALSATDAKPHFRIRPDGFVSTHQVVEPGTTSLRFQILPTAERPASTEYMIILTGIDPGSAPYACATSIKAGQTYAIASEQGGMRLADFQLVSVQLFDTAKTSAEKEAVRERYWNVWEKSFGEDTPQEYYTNDRVNDQLTEVLETWELVEKPEEELVFLNRIRPPFGMSDATQFDVFKTNRKAFASGSCPDKRNTIPEDGSEVPICRRLLDSPLTDLWEIATQTGSQPPKRDTVETAMKKLRTYADKLTKEFGPQLCQGLSELKVLSDGSPWVGLAEFVFPVPAPDLELAGVYAFGSVPGTNASVRASRTAIVVTGVPPGTRLADIVQVEVSGEARILGVSRESVAALIGVVADSIGADSQEISNKLNDPKFDVPDRETELTCDSDYTVRPTKVDYVRTDALIVETQTPGRTVDVRVCKDAECAPGKGTHNQFAIERKPRIKLAAPIVIGLDFVSMQNPNNDYRYRLSTNRSGPDAAYTLSEEPDHAAVIKTSLALGATYFGESGIGYFGGLDALAISSGSKLAWFDRIGAAFGLETPVSRVFFLLTFGVDFSRTTPVSGLAETVIVPDGESAPTPLVERDPGPYVTLSIGVDSLRIVDEIGALFSDED